MKENTVSVITPVYNAEKHIEETIEAVLKQTFKNFEYILIDDCSSDSSENIIKKYAEKDKRIKYVRLKENLGAAVARNTGLSIAKGKYIAFIDSDDLWYEDKLCKQIQFMEKNNIGFSFTSYKVFEKNKIINEIEVPNKINYNGLLKNTIIGCSTVLINKQIIGDFTMPNVRKGQDTLTWLNILSNNQYAYGLNDSLTIYRVVKGSISNNKFGALKRTWNNYRKVLKLNFFKSIYYYSYYVVNAVKKRVIKKNKLFNEL